MKNTKYLTGKIKPEFKASFPVKILHVGIAL